MLGFCWVGLAFQKRLQTAHEHFGQLRLFPIQPEALRHADGLLGKLEMAAQTNGKTITNICNIL